MYNYEISNNVFNVFQERLIEYIKVLKEKSEELQKEQDNANFINELKENFTIENILKNKELINKQYPQLAENIKILEYFYSKNAINTEQARGILEFIKNFLFKNKIENKKEELDKLTKEIKNCENVLNKQYDNDFILYIVDKLGFSEEDQINILSNITYNTCKGEVKVFEEQQEIKEEKIETNIDVTHLIEKYKDLEKRIKPIIDKYYILISSKDEAHLKYTRQVCDYIKKCKINNIEPEIEDNFNYTEESLIILLINIMEYRKELLSNFNLFENNITTENNKDYLEMLITLIEEEFFEILKISEDYEKEQYEEKTELSNVYILIDSNGKIVYNDSSFSKEDYKKVNSLMDKLNKGIYDYNKGILHSKLQTNYDKNTVFINKISDMACAYIRIDSDKVLIINVDKSENIYTSTDQILNKYSKIIEENIENIKNNNSKILVLQEIIKANYTQRGLK